MRFSKEQMELLKPFEGYFETAVKANWSRNPGRSGLKVIHEVFTKATGDPRRYNDNCNTCILNLLRDCGSIYFASKSVTIAEEEKPVVRKRAISAKRKE